MPSPTVVRALIITLLLVVAAPLLTACSSKSHNSTSDVKQGL